MNRKNKRENALGLSAQDLISLDRLIRTYGKDKLRQAVDQFEPGKLAQYLHDRTREDAKERDQN